MAAKIEQLYGRFHGNAHPAMVADLAAHLNVKPESVAKFAVGWVPIVTFKKGKNYQGWWAIPERDADSEVVGISLRSQNDIKVMYPGSNHGLVYEVNPHHRQGEHGYSPGPQNWARTMDVGHECPVCHKPDGCLLSAENPADPKAAICIREKSDRELRFGFLHILKPEGNLNEAPLPPSSDPVVIVEGFSDACAVSDFDLVAVGRPSNLAGLHYLRDLVRGRDCVVVGENDQKSDGRWPGREGMLAAYTTIKSTAKSVKMVMPPTHVKDFRVWKNKYGLTRESFLEYVAKEGKVETDNTIIDDDQPLTIARAFLRDRFKISSQYTLRRWEETWYEFRECKYVPLTREEILAPLYFWSEDKHMQVETAKGMQVKKLVAKPAMKEAVEQGLIAETLLKQATVPQWINGIQGPNTKDLIIFSNGILDVPAFLDGGHDYLLDSTPALFTTTALPFAFDPTALCPTWLYFLQSSLGDDPAKILLLQEWFGYVMTPDISFEKMMYLRGPTAAGKGTVLDVLTAMMGKDQVVDVSFSNLASAFGRAPLMGKLLATMGDVRVPKDGSATRGLELLLNIVCGDGVQIERKYRDSIEKHTLTCRITAASNEMLDVPDHAGALNRRMNVIVFTRSFKENPIRDLKEKLRAEVPGIAVWALAGLRRLRKQGHFTVPASSLVELDNWRVTLSPTAGFLEDACEDAPGVDIEKNTLYDAWAKWSQERRMAPVTPGRFYERVHAAKPGIISETYEKAGRKMSVFRNLTLKSWAIKSLLGRPG